MSADPSADSINRITADLIRLGAELMGMHRALGFRENMPAWQLRELVSDAIALRQPLTQLMSESAPQDTPPSATQPPNADALIERYRHKVAVLRVLCDHAAGGGQWRTSDAVSYQASVAYFPRSEHRYDHQARWQEQDGRDDAMRNALGECAREGLTEPFRQGIRLSVAGKAWLARCDREWLERYAAD